MKSTVYSESKRRLGQGDDAGSLGCHVWMRGGIGEVDAPKIREEALPGRIRYPIVHKAQFRPDRLEMAHAIRDGRSRIA